jgi:hypothetical protein
MCSGAPGDESGDIKCALLCDEMFSHITYPGFRLIDMQSKEVIQSKYIINLQSPEVTMYQCSGFLVTQVKK